MAFKVSWLGILLARLRVMEVVFGRSSFGGSGFWLGMGHMSELLLIRVKIKSGEQGGREEEDPMEDFVEMEMVRMTLSGGALVAGMYVMADRYKNTESGSSTLARAHRLTGLLGFRTRGLCIGCGI